MKWLFLGVLLLAGNSQANDIAKASRDYVDELESCGFDHGYSCMPQEESDFLGIEADKAMVPGNYLKAFEVAASAFGNEQGLEPAQRDLKHYKIGFSENPDQYIVHFQGLLMPEVKDGEVIGMTRGIYGRATRYWINKQTLTIDKRLFYK